MGCDKALGMPILDPHRLAPLGVWVLRRGEDAWVGQWDHAIRRDGAERAADFDLLVQVSPTSPLFESAD